jgi:hypothetical protein
MLRMGMMSEAERVVGIVYRGVLPFREMVSPEEPWKAGDRVVSKYGDGAGTVWLEDDDGDPEGVGVVFDAAPDVLAWMCDFELRKE